MVVAAFATSSVTSAVSSAGSAISNVAGSAASTATQAAANQPSSDYFLDTLFRKDQPDTNISSPDARAEAGRIVARAVTNGNLDPNDRAYLAKLVAARTGISQQDAEKRVDDGMNQIKAAEPKPRPMGPVRHQQKPHSSFLLDADWGVYRFRSGCAWGPATGPILNSLEASAVSRPKCAV